MPVTITKISSHQILNSRRNPTIETEIVLSDGTNALASVPSGASKGLNEAQEIPVKLAIKNIQEIIAPVLVKKDPFQQKNIDKLLINLDGTKNKSRLGANAILSVSLAVAKASSESLKKPLYEYLYTMDSGQARMTKGKIPVCLFNIINGGKHAHNSLSIQEFHLIPQLPTFSQNLSASQKIYHSLDNLLKERGYAVDLGDEAGFAPELKNTKEALDLIIMASGNSGYKMGQDVFLGLDIAANSLATNHHSYLLDGQTFTTETLLSHYQYLLSQYPLIYLEDPFSEYDWEGFIKITKIMGTKIHLATDDLTVTNPQIFSQAARVKAGNTIVVKYNQIGTLTETLEVVKQARLSGWKVVIAHRSGETDDDFEADLAVAVASDFAKFGAPAQRERVAKYHRLLKIEESLNL